MDKLLAILLVIGLYIWCIIDLLVIFTVAPIVGAFGTVYTAIVLYVRGCDWKDIMNTLSEYSKKASDVWNIGVQYYWAVATFNWKKADELKPFMDEYIEEYKNRKNR